MQGPIAQIISLTLAGNAAARACDFGRYWPDDDAFKFCRSIRFFDGSSDEPDDRLTVIALDPADWLRRCAAPGVSVRLRYAPSPRSDLSDRLSVGFVGGGGVWSMTVTGATPVAGGWQAHWRIGDRKAADRRIWEVGYFRQSITVAAADQPRPADLIVALKTTLSAIEDFARCQDLSQFADCFARARDLLGAAALPEKPMRQQLDPFSLLPDGALRLLLASEAAWVFGGMGSWNDLGFSGEDGRLYERLSDDLFSLLTQVMVAAVNQAADA